MPRGPAGPHPIGLDWLSKCRTAAAARDYLGERLAPWLLTAAARADAMCPPPFFAVENGAVWPIFVWSPGRRRDRSHHEVPPVYARAFLLPLRWERSVADASALPSGLPELAGEVRRVVAGGADQWGLRLGRALEGAVDLAPLSIDATSAFAPLTAALLVALNGGEPQPHVFATGGWSTGGITPVGGVADKVQACIDALAHDPSDPNTGTLFVPAENWREAEAATKGRVEIRSYPVAAIDLPSALDDHLAMLHAPPGHTWSLQARLGYSNLPYVAASPRSQVRRDYYLSHLLDDLAERLKEKSPAAKPERLALAVSFNYEVAALVGRATEAAHVLALHTADTAECAEKVQAILQQNGASVSLRPIVAGSEQETLPGLVSWLDGCQTGAVDITGGTKAMTALLIRAAQRAKATVLYLDHEIVHNRPRIGSETLRVLSWLDRG